MSNAILVVEDNQEDYQIILRAFKQLGLNSVLRHAGDGEETMNYLLRKGKYKDTQEYPWPSAILLDLKVPGMDGKEILQKIKSFSNLKEIPVIMFSTSFQEQDKIDCNKLGAHSYVEKPVNYYGFIDTVKEISRTIKALK